MVRELRRRERLRGALPWLARNPLLNRSRSDLGPGKVLSFEVSSHDALPPTSWGPRYLLLRRLQLPVPEAETDPGPAPLSSTAPGRVRQGEGGRRGRPLAWPASALGPRQPQVTPAKDPAWGVLLQLEGRCPETSGLLGGERAGGIREGSASAPLPTREGRTRFGKVERLPGWGQRGPLLPSRGQAALEAPVFPTP